MDGRVREAVAALLDEVLEKGRVGARYTVVRKTCIDEEPVETREEQGDKRLLELGFGTVYQAVGEMLDDVEAPDPYDWEDDWDEEDASYSTTNEYVGRWKGVPIHVAETYSTLYEKGPICEKETRTGTLTIRRITEDEYRRTVNEYLGIPDDEDEEGEW